MVISYASAGTGSWYSFFTITPLVLLHCTGSIIGNVLPQVLIATGLGVVACYRNPLDRLSEDADPAEAFNLLTFLISFLLVFKTQSSYNQHWGAITHIEGLVAAYRELGICACTNFNWSAGKEIKQYTRKVLRLLVLHFCVVLEYFRRSGSDATVSKQAQDRMRSSIQRLAGPNEYTCLYPGEGQRLPGSQSQYPHTHQVVIVFWIDLVISRCFNMGGLLSPPHASAMSRQTHALVKQFRAMDQLDKTQFPLPYAQLVKLVLILWIFTLPFVLQRKVDWFTPVAMFIISLAMFGLDEVAEIMECPFGEDPNAVLIEEYIDELVTDLELLFYSRELEMDSVFTDDNELCLRGITEFGTSESERALDSYLRGPRGALPTPCCCGQVGDLLLPPTPHQLREAIKEVTKRKRSASAQFRHQQGAEAGFGGEQPPPAAKAAQWAAALDARAPEPGAVAGFEGEQPPPAAKGVQWAAALDARAPEPGAVADFGGEQPPPAAKAVQWPAAMVAKAPEPARPASREAALPGAANFGRPLSSSSVQPCHRAPSRERGKVSKTYDAWLLAEQQGAQPH